MSFVFLVDTNRQPLSPVHPGRARILLKAGKAAVLKRYPFTLILKAAIEQPQVQPLRIKLDPGSRTTGIAIVDDKSGQVLFAAELTHRSQEIKKALNEPPSGTPWEKSTPYQIPQAQVSESHQATRLACPVLKEQSVQHRDLGEAPAQSLPHHGDQYGTRSLRSAPHAEPRNKRHPIPAGNACRL